MKKNKLIKFSYLPGSWGLSGHIYKEAEASYYYDGEDLDRELAKIRYYDDNRIEYNRRIAEIEYKYNHIDEYTRDVKIAALDLKENTLDFERKKIEIALNHKKISSFEYDMSLAKLEFSDNKLELERRILDVKFKHGMINALDHDTELLKLNGELTKEAEIELSFKYKIIDEYTKDTKLAKLIHDKEEKELALLEVEYKHGKIKKNNFDKKKATLLKEPWIDIIDHGFDKKKGINGVYFEFDWNNFWIEYLELNGYVGKSEDEIVESWFSDVCNSNTIDDENDMKVPEDENF